MKTLVQVHGPFFGPDFVKGWGDQSAGYTIVNSTTATLTFNGGFTTDTFTQTLTGTGFGITADGRLTGTVTSFVGVNNSIPDTYWTFTNISVPLNIMNTQATSLDFADLLVSPTSYKYIGDVFDDYYIMSSFNDIARGKAGDDSFFALSGNDKLYGGPGADELVGDQGNDILYGGRGNDMLLGGIGLDDISGMKGNDTIYGGGDADIINGDQGRDTIFGDHGSDTIRGGDNGDTIDGGAGADVIIGGKGRDHLDGGLDEDTIRGGAGKDVISAGPVDDVAGDKMFGGAGDDMINGYKGVDVLRGGKGDDSLYGGDNLDKLHGGSGDDIVVGGTGSDTIIGGKGNDQLSGNEAGAVVLDDGLNKFIFAGDFGKDVITDFHIGFDTIGLVGISEDDVTVKTKGDDVKVIVEEAGHGRQTILVEGVASEFDADIDIVYA